MQFSWTIWDLMALNPVPAENNRLHVNHGSLFHLDTVLLTRHPFFGFWSHFGAVAFLLTPLLYTNNFSCSGEVYETRVRLWIKVCTPAGWFNIKMNHTTCIINELLYNVFQWECGLVSCSKAGLNCSSHHRCLNLFCMYNFIFEEQASYQV